MGSRKSGDEVPLFSNICPHPPRPDSLPSLCLDAQLGSGFLGNMKGFAASKEEQQKTQQTQGEWALYLVLNKACACACVRACVCVCVCARMCLRVCVRVCIYFCVS
jgi:hypothetical protein